jgi:hypothetical protein
LILAALSPGGTGLGWLDAGSSGEELFGEPSAGNFIILKNFNDLPYRCLPANCRLFFSFYHLPQELQGLFRFFSRPPGAFPG